MIVLYHFVLFVCFTVLLDYDTTQGCKHGKDVYISIHQYALVGKLV